MAPAQVRFSQRACQRLAAARWRWVRHGGLWAVHGAAAFISAFIRAQGSRVAGERRLAQLHTCTALADGDRHGPIAIAIAGRGDGEPRTGRPGSSADSHRHLASQDENGRSTPAAHESTLIRHARCRQSHGHTPYIVAVQAASYESDGHTCQQSAGNQTTAASAS